MPKDSSTPDGVTGDRDSDAETTAEITTGGTESTAEAAEPTASTAPAETRAEKMEKRNRGFSRWRKGRPFAAGLLMMLAGIVIMAPAYLSFSISNIQIQISSMGGVSTLVIGILLITCGVMTWFRGEGRLFAGVAAMVLSVLALWQSNFAGFGIGLILGLVGGALALAWDPQPRDEAKADKAAKKAAKQERKNRKHSGAAGTTAKSVLAVVAALGVGIGIQTPDARAQIPGLPDLEIPDIQLPGQGNGGDGNTGDNRDNGAPRVPGLDNLPDLPDIPTPDLPNLPEFRLPDGNELQDGIDSLGVDIPGLNIAPPPPVPGMIPPNGNTFTIKSDVATMTPGMKMSFVTVDTLQGPKKSLRIDADQAILQNLRVQFPNTLGADMMQDTLGDTSTLTGNFHIFTKKVTMTLELLGVNTQVPITIDADWAPDDIAKELSKLGLGLPDLISGKTRVLDARMETYHVSADTMDFPSTEVKTWVDD